MELCPHCYQSRGEQSPYSVGCWVRSARAILAFLSIAYCTISSIQYFVAIGHEVHHTQYVVLATAIFQCKRRSSVCAHTPIRWRAHRYLVIRDSSIGPANVRVRAEANTDPEELALYGGGQWPHFSAYTRRELSSNSNYYEVDAIAVRHGICGDPGQVRRRS